MGYKTKNCPKCGTEHNKRGEYCSRSCGNSRKPTKEHREKLSAVRREWHATSDTAAVVAYNYVNKGINGVPEPIAPMKSNNLENNQFISDGDLWTEV
jgi:hypothetical protein